MQTTAVYDPSSQEFVINTPTTLAQKYWITNGAVRGSDVHVAAWRRSIRPLARI